MKEQEKPTILLGQTLSFTGDPFKVGVNNAYTHEEKGAVEIRGGKVMEVGPAKAILAKKSGANIQDYGDGLVMAGFVDSHVHYPQTDIIGAYNNGLLEWLKKHTFPCESQFGDHDIAANAAEFFLDQCLMNGVTSASVYCTVHAQSVERFFEAASKRNVAMAAGKVCMDDDAPGNLVDTAQSSYDESKELLQRWHQKGRNKYAITPRFALTSTPSQMEQLGALWKEYPSALMQTHLSETTDEIAAVMKKFPKHRDYFDVYQSFGLTGPGAIFGHCIYLSDEERRSLAQSGAAIAHCPTSNAFMGSGVFDLKRTRQAASDINVSIASDVGAGTSFSMFATMKGAYEAARATGNSLHPIEAFWLATIGGARAMRLDDRLGNLTPGMDADLVVLNLKSTPLLARRVDQASDFQDVLFAQMIMAGERAIKATYIAGALVHERSFDGLG